ncbi:hypothetical protein [Paraburkholderia caledonica]|uniref:Zn finger protein HypA/HybF involved in hydrogenase expression n=1 Tax=Paraburkholderia caledonica TaxID=134536 RepID=A0AB73IV45_9BURK|nr:Zn finger protein HypA/HybF involved in hydrogenase expression [Paraburkholderia caledonica]
MSADLKEPSQLIAGMSHKEMLEIMAANNIFCGHDRFARILMDAQRRALAAQALERMTQNAEGLDLYDEPQCWCSTCRPITLADTRMVLCPKCGNKRCPHATNHVLACTGSNEPGQKGSSYEHCAPIEERE